MSRSTPRRHRSQVRGLIVVFVAVSVATLGGIIGYRPLLAATGWEVTSGSQSSAPSPTTPRSATASPGSAPPAGSGGAGLVDLPAAATPGPLPAKAKLATRIEDVAVVGAGTTSGYVVDAVTGGLLYGSRATGPLIPASTMKVLTGLAVLDSVGAGTTFATRVVAVGSGQIILVGGGDPYLTATPDTTYPRAQSATHLASQTATALKASGTTAVTLGFDDSLFAGADWHPTWPAAYFGNVVPIHALSLDGGRDASGTLSRTPQVAAATTFAALLRSQGITVTGKPVAKRVPAGAVEVARVESLPVEIVVQQALLHSDNVATEVLLRHLAIANRRPSSFDGGRAALVERLTALKVWEPGATIVDGSGLSRSNLVPARMLASAIRVAMTSPHLGGLVDGLPVAGVSGTLAARYVDDSTLPGRGWVHAKTGSLTKVSTLAGYTTTRQGRVLVFAFMSNGATNELGVRLWLDQVTGALTSCGC